MSLAADTATALQIPPDSAPYSGVSAGGVAQTRGQGSVSTTAFLGGGGPP